MLVGGRRVENVAVAWDALPSAVRDRPAGFVMGLMAEAADGAVVEVPAGRYREVLAIVRPVKRPCRARSFPSLSSALPMRC